jgi:D-alanyl-D-alanine carboxypeptidase/D-alanyl-D-alanine-endopeptidase (penicillin-binding protein 4)
MAHTAFTAERQTRETRTHGHMSAATRRRGGSYFAALSSCPCAAPDRRVSVALRLILFILLLPSLPAVAQDVERQRERQVAGPTGVAPAATAPAPPAPKTLEELHTRLQEILRDPRLEPAQTAIKVASLDTGRTLYEENATKLLKPASNMKLYTVAAALDRLSPDFRFKTSIYVTARPDASGAVRGDLIVYGRGDPTMAASLNNGDYFKAMDTLAARIAAAGVRRVEGDIIGDESYFTGPPYGSGWEWDDLQWYYGAEISALTVNDNALDLFVKPGPAVGDPCRVMTGPITPLVTIINRTTTALRGTRRELSVYRGLGENVIEVSGQLAQDDAGYTGSIAISRPALLFVSMLRDSLARQGIKIKGRTRAIDARARAAAPLPASLVEIASLESPPLSFIAAQILKPSQNLYTELLLRALGRATATDPKLTSAEAGTAAVKAFLREAGIDPDRLALVDGSGLSRRDLVTAEATLQLLVYMSRHRYAAAFRDALPVAGVDGTLKNRMKWTPAAGNARAKTGTLGGVATLSGYVTSAAGERLVFSIMINNSLDEFDVRRNFIDNIVVLLASFAGRS